MSRKTYSFALTGGLDEVSQPLAVKPGVAIAALNHEVVDGGYARVGGYERFDGRTGPTDFPFYLLDFTEGTMAVVAGATVVGALSGATGIALADAALSEGEWDGSGFGTLGLRAVSGSFVASETLLVGGVPAAVAVAPQSLGVAGSGDSEEEALSEAARDYARALIGEVPGAGDVRGVWEFGGVLIAFRDNSLGTAGGMFKSSASGWQAVDLGYTLDFTSGSSEPNTGDTITGATSSATATIRRVVVTSGDWQAGTAAGYFVLSGPAGTFGSENLNVDAASDVATIAGVATAITLPPGGKYFFVNHNFYGASDRRRVYGCNGVGYGFEFDGTYFVPIRTGMVADAPTRVTVFRNQLFFAFAGGSVQNSAPAEPISFEPILGAAEIGVGSDVADFISTVDSLTILTENGIFNLTGFDSSDWQLSTITDEAGAKPYTAQHFGAGLYLDDRGLRSISATQAYGNFAMATLTQSVKRTLDRKRAVGITAAASCIVRTKNHYRLFFADGAGLSFYLGRKYPEPMYFELGKVLTCISSNESSDGSERMFFGADDGFVYQLDKGSSFDGEPIEAFVQLAYAHMGSPQILKRVHKISLEVVANGGTTLGIATEYDYSSNEQTDSSHTSATAQGAGGLWGVANWGEFYWSSPAENIVDAWVEGQGRNASVIIYSNSHLIAPYELRGATIYYGERGAIR